MDFDNPDQQIRALRDQLADSYRRMGKMQAIIDDHANIRTVSLKDAKERSDELPWVRSSQHQITFIAGYRSVAVPISKVREAKDMLNAAQAELSAALTGHGIAEAYP